MTPEERLQYSMAKLRYSLHEVELAFVDLAQGMLELSSHLIAWEATCLAAYRAAGSPHGETAEGMTRWAAEHFHRRV